MGAMPTSLHDAVRHRSERLRTLPTYAKIPCMDQPNLPTALALAEEQVRRAQAIVKGQEVTVAGLKAIGSDAAEAEQLLATLRSNLLAFEKVRDRLRSEFGGSN